MNIKETVGRQNIEKANYPKKIEFHEFCDFVYGNADYPRRITVKNACMYYITFRKRRSGGRFAKKKKD